MKIERTGLPEWASRPRLSAWAVRASRCRTVCAIKNQRRMAGCRPDERRGMAGRADGCDRPAGH